MIVRPALQAGDNRPIYQGGNIGFGPLHFLQGGGGVAIGENYGSARATQGLVRGRGDHISHTDRIGVDAAGDQSRYMGHVGQHKRADFFGDGFIFFPLINLRISAAAGDN